MGSKEAAGLLCFCWDHHRFWLQDHTDSFSIYTVKVDVSCLAFWYPQSQELYPGTSIVTDSKEVKFYEPTLTNRKQKPQKQHGLHLTYSKSHGCFLSTWKKLLFVESRPSGQEFMKCRLGFQLLSRLTWCNWDWDGVRWADLWHLPQDVKLKVEMPVRRLL